MSDVAGSLFDIHAENAWDSLLVFTRGDIGGNAGLEPQLGDIVAASAAGDGSAASQDRTGTPTINVERSAEAVAAARHVSAADLRDQGAHDRGGNVRYGKLPSAPNMKAVRTIGKPGRPPGRTSSSPRGLAPHGPIVAKATRNEYGGGRASNKVSARIGVENNVVRDALTVNNMLARSAGGFPHDSPKPSRSTAPGVPGVALGVKKKKAARARVGDLLPEFIHSCPFEGCSKKFAKKYNLKIHVRRHAGDLPFQCELPQCQKRFMWQSSFERHQKSHLRKPKGKRKKSAAGGAPRAGPSSGFDMAGGSAPTTLGTSMIPSQLLMSTGTGPEVPESILSAIVSAGGGSPFDENSALHSAQLFCTGPAIALAGPMFDASSARQAQPQHLENNRLTKNDFNSISALQPTVEHLQAAAIGGNHPADLQQSNQSYSHHSISREDVNNMPGAAARTPSEQHGPESAHNTSEADLLSSEFAQLFSPVSDAAALNFLQAGLEAHNNPNTNIPHMSNFPTHEVLPPNTFPNLPVTSSPTSGASVPEVTQYLKQPRPANDIPQYQYMPAQQQQGNVSAEQAEFGVGEYADFEESFAYLLDSIR